MEKNKLLSINKKKVIYTFIITLLVLITVFFSIACFTGRSLLVRLYLRASGSSEEVLEPDAERSGKLAIVIDDFGQNRAGVKEMMSIGRHITFAIMPFLTFTRSDAENAHTKGYEVIVHLPLEATSGKMSWVGPRPILTTMNDNDIHQLVIDSFESVPNAVGANIHMGSKASDDERVVSDILEIVKIKNLYFVDSRTGHHPIAKNIADSSGVLCYDRDVFLDGKKSKSYIKNQLTMAGDIALKKGKALAIGHVGTEGGKITAEAISEALEEFDNKNVKLVYVSELN